MAREYTAKEAFAELKSKYSGDEENKISPIKAIRAKCLDCCCGQTNEVLLCTCTDCPLYVFRFGKNPFTKSPPYTQIQPNHRPVGLYFKMN